MTGFIDLPREIRDEILLSLIKAHSKPSPLVSQVEKANTRRDPNDVSAKKVRYPPPGSQASAINSLMLVNRQMYHEMRDALVYHSNVGGSHLKLDVLISGNKFLHPTWIHALPYVPTVKTLHVQLRPYGPWVDDSTDPHKGFVAAWHLGDLLNTILSRGPDFNFTRQAKTFVVEELVLEIMGNADAGDPEQPLERGTTLRDFFVGHYNGLLTNRMKREDAPWGLLFLSSARQLVLRAFDEHVFTVDVRAKAEKFGIRLVEPPVPKMVDRTRPLRSAKPARLRGSEKWDYLHPW